MSKTITIHGTTTESGMSVKWRSLQGDHTNDDAWNTAAQIMRNRTAMFKELGYLFLDSEQSGLLDKNRLL